MTIPDLHLIGGPTASGKSARALDLAQRLDGVVINADAMQIYQGLPILTAQPDEAEKKAVPHKLYEITPPACPSSVGKWLEAAEQAIAETLLIGKTPILVGGTGLYFKALTEGLASIPPVLPEDHQIVVDRYEKLGSDPFRAELAALDPENATKIKPNDRQRLIRAYEVARFTGHPLSFWQEQGKPSAIIQKMRVIRHLVLPERTILYENCDKRFLQMMDRGALAEVQALLALNIPSSSPAMKILGVPDLAAYLSGDMTLNEAIAKAQQATRNYAKRQVTWFKNQWPQ